MKKFYKNPAMIATSIILIMVCAVALSVVFGQRKEKASADFVTSYQRVNDAEISLFLEYVSANYPRSDADLTGAKLESIKEKQQDFVHKNDEFLKMDFSNTKYAKLHEEYKELSAKHSDVIAKSAEIGFYYGIFNRSSTYESDKLFYERFDLMKNSQDSEFKRLVHDVIDEYPKSDNIQLSEEEAILGDYFIEMSKKQLKSKDAYSEFDKKVSESFKGGFLK